MHTHLEIIMPRGYATNEEDAATAILARFDEDGKGKDRSRDPFWDYWNIGGRWSGTKLMHKLGRDRIAAFRKELADRRVTVSGVQFGKRTLRPASQIPMVDGLWREAFPDSGINQCPIFDHYTGTSGDIMRLADCPRDLLCEHVIIAGPDYDGKKLEAKYMLRTRIYNGVAYQNTTWDGTIGAALDGWEQYWQDCDKEYRAKMAPTDDWIVVTVDYHS